MTSSVLIFRLLLRSVMEPLQNEERRLDEAAESLSHLRPLIEAVNG